MADKSATQYMLIPDDDGHWYVIPATKRDEWYIYMEALYRFWEEMPEGVEEPAQPDWVIEIGGAPTRVKFSDYEIE